MQAILKKDIKTVMEIHNQCEKFLEKSFATIEEMSIEEIGLSARAFHVLCHNGIVTIGELSRFKTITDYNDSARRWEKFCRRNQGESCFLSNFY